MGCGAVSPMEAWGLGVVCSMLGVGREARVSVYLPFLSFSICQMKPMLHFLLLCLLCGGKQMLPALGSQVVLDPSSSNR